MIRLYGVSHGNGNDGVSHMFADYYVRTDDPWTLARAAMLAEFKAGEGKAFCLDNLEVDGEAEFTIHAMILEHPEVPDWSEGNGAWMLCDVFPEEEPRDGAPVYESLAEAFDESDLKLAARD